MAVLNNSEVDAQTKTRSFRPAPFHLHKTQIPNSCLFASPFQCSVRTATTIAGVLGLECFLRKADNQSKRLLFLLDAGADLGAFDKGRSSAPTLFRAVQEAAALQLAGDLVVQWVYTTSERNPADAPSRGLRQDDVPHRKRMSPRVNQPISKTTFRPRLA